MFRWKLHTLMGECRDKGVHVTYRSIFAETGVSTRALVGMSKNKIQNANEKSIHELLTYFSVKLGRAVQFDELLEWDYTTVPPERKPRKRSKAPTN
jgi:hypothetical protein